MPLTGSRGDGEHAVLADRARSRALRLSDEEVLAFTNVYDIPYCPHEPTPHQAAFLSLMCREAFYGGAAGGGKSDALLMAALQYVHVPGYSALILRRNYADLALPDAIMDRAGQWLRPTDARSRDGGKKWVFPGGGVLQFGYLEHPNQRFRYQSAAFQFIAFDEVTQFTEVEYRYLFTRLRRLVGSDVPLRMRSGANPDGPGLQWVKARFVTGGRAKGRAFIPARLTDNPHLDRREYERTLRELDPVTRARYLAGDWDARDSGVFFQRQWFGVQDAPMARGSRVRYWDLAATEEEKPVRRRRGDPDWTCGVLMCARDGLYRVEDVRHVRARPGEVERLIRRTAELDGPQVVVGVEREPGASGKLFAQHMRRHVLRGFPVKVVIPSGSKVTRARPVASAAEGDLITIVRAPWAETFLEELEAFPDVAHDDQVDSLSGAYAVLTGMAVEGDDEAPQERLDHAAEGGDVGYGMAL